MNVFELRLDRAATPERVAAAATFIDRMLKAAFPDLPEGSITLVVTNYAMGAGVRARSAEGRRAVQFVMNFLTDPQKKRRSGQARAVSLAKALSERSPELESAEIVRSRGGKVLATLGDELRTKMQAISSREAPEAHVLRGGTLVYSPVLRVGRKVENGPVKVRLRLNGKVSDVALAPKTPVGPFFDAAKKGGEFPISLDTAWIRDLDGNLDFDIRATKATGIDLEWSPISGAEFVQVVNRLTPEAFDNVDEIVAQIEGWE